MDPHTTLVLFETIGLIKKSLQCSICLDLLNDPHSTRCNHQFCSCCIRKVVDERKDKKQEALCPLCKNPITKRSLTSNPRLNEIVDVVKRLNNAFQEDAGIPDSPYPLVNSKLNGQSFLKFSRLNPTPLKPVVFNSPKSDGLRTEEQLSSSVNHLHSFNTSQCSRKQTWLDKSLSSPKVLSREQRNSRPFEILSLLESEENSETEQPTTCIGKEVDQNDNSLQENCGNTNLASTRRSSPSTPYQTKNNRENVNTDNTRSLGSSTIDVGKSSQSSSILSDNSVSILDGLLSQQSRDKVVVQVKLEHVDVEVPGVEKEKLCHSLTSNTRNILKSLQEDNDNIEQKEFLGNKHEFGGTPDVDGNRSKQSPSSAKGVNGIVTTKPKIARSKSVQSPGFSNSVERTPDQYSSERVPASVDSDSQSYNVIPLPLYQSDDMISPEFPRPSSLGVLVGQDNDNCEINNPTDDNTSSESKLSLFSEKEESRGELIQTEQPEVRHAGNIYAPENCGNSEASLVSQSKSENSARRQKYKRKHRDTNEGSAEFSSPCSCPTISGAEKKISSDENIDSTVKEILSQDELCLPSECDLIQNEQTKAALSVESLQNSENSKHSEASIISPSPSGRSFRNRQFKRKRSAEDNNSLTKFPRFNGEMGVLEISVENHRKAYEHGSDKSGLKNIVSKHASCTSQEASKKTSNNLHIKMDVSEVNDLPVDPRPKANRSDDSEDDIIPPTPPDVGCAPCKKPSTSMIKVQSPAVRGHAYKDDVDNDNDGGGDEKLFRARSNKFAKIRKRQCEVELADQDDCFDENYDDKETSKLQTNDTSGKIPVWENEEVHAPDNVLKHDACRSEGEVMNASNEGECPIIDDDQMYSSQEDLNVALLRRLAPDSASHKGSDNETESDDETSDCKNTDTTSISSLTDADGVEVSSQRIKYLHEVLAQTGGEIEKLTTDLKNLRQNEVNVQPNKLKNNHSDFDKNDSGLKINKENFDDDSSSDKEEEKVCDFDKESDTRDSHQGSSSEKENENSETSDVENNVTKREAAANFNDQDKEINVTCKNKDSKAFAVMYDVPSEKDQIESGESAEEDGVTKNDHVPDNYESDGGNYNNHDDEIMERCSLSPPPTLDHSLIKLTKLPPAIRNLKKMLQQDGDSEEEQDNSNYVNSSRDPFRKTLSELQKLFRKNPSSHITDVQDVPNHRSRDPHMSHPDSLQRTDMPKNNQLKKTESRNESGQKENSAEIKQRSVSRNKFQENYKYGNNVQKTGESSDGVLTEVRANTVSKQRTLISMFGNSLNHEIKKTIQISKPSPCFVITRLPKQFVSLAGYLAKRNGGKMSDDVSEETTHIIMPTDSNMQASRKNYTIKYLLGIALGKWIVSQHWITACVKSGRLIDEKHYEVKGDVEAAQSHVPNLARITCENKSPLLFDGISVVCFGKFNGAISRVQLCQLVQYCGGKLIDFSYELLAGRVTSDLIIICDSTLSEKRGMQIKDLCERYRTFPVSAEWVTDSVANYQLQDIEEYSMGI